MDKLVEEQELVVDREMFEEDVNNDKNRRNHVVVDHELVVQIEVIRKCLILKDNGKCCQASHIFVLKLYAMEFVGMRMSVAGGKIINRLMKA